MTRLISNNPVTYRVLIPKKLNITGMIAPIRDASIKAAADMGKDLDKVQKTWKGERARIQTEAKIAPHGTGKFPMAHEGFVARAWPRVDGSKGYKKWLWLDLGTKWRYAVMSPGFVAKTHPGQLNSWKGKGMMVFVRKKLPENRMPGIKARHFTVALRKKWTQPFRDRMAAAVKKAVKASGHAVR